MMNIAIFAIIGLLTGVAFGFVGDAATAAVVPLLLIFKAVPSVKHAIGTSMGMLLPPVGITGVYTYYKEGYVNIKASMIMAMIFMVSSFITARLVKKIQEQTIKNFVSVFLIILGIGTYFI